jgi:hypothetical protein
MNTKLKGDLAEQAAVFQAVKRGFGVSKPVGDRLPYDLVFDVNGCLLKIQVKCAWFYLPVKNYVVDNRRTKTNRRVMKRSCYQKNDFDFALVYLSEKDIFYIFPFEVFVSFKGEIHMVESEKRQRKPRSSEFREAWNLILQRAVRPVMAE